MAVVKQFVDAHAREELSHFGSRSCATSHPTCIRIDGCDGTHAHANP